MTAKDEYIAALQELAASGALPWLQSDDVRLFARFGFGVIPNRAQIRTWARLQADPDSGLFHVLRWGNRSTKTTTLTLFHMWCIWKKWRLDVADFDGWLAYEYKTLATAPLVKLVGKMHAQADALIRGISDAQYDKATRTYREAPLGRFFEAGKSTGKAGDDELWIRCINGAKVDLLSTSGGAGRIEGEGWWFLSWDEFARQQPVTDVPLLIDQTFLPRSSDHMAPVVLAGTSTEDFDAVYLEIEEKAERQPDRWRFSTEDRSVNFAQSRASIERQRQMSFDINAVERSISGGVGEGGTGPFPFFLLDNAFRDDLPERMAKSELPPDWSTALSFDHALRHDDNALLGMGIPWPPLPDDLLKQPATGISLDVIRGSRSLTPTEQFAMVERGVRALEPRAVIIDATAEGGLMVYRQARSRGLPAVDCSFTSRTQGSIRVSNKEYGIQALQRLLAWGLPVEFDESGWIADWPEPDPERPFGLLRFPATGTWGKAKRQLAMYRRKDVGLTQDIAMALVMFAWWLFKYLDAGSVTHKQRISMTRGYGPRSQRSRRVRVLR